MNEERGIVWISAAMVAGMGAAAASGIFKPGFAIHFLVATSAMLAVSRSNYDFALVCLLWAITGYFCYSSWALTGRSFTSPLDIDWLCRLTDSAPFKNDETRALLKALLTGRKDSLSKDTVTAFRQSGASHVIALSGLHLGIIHACVDKTALIFGKSLRSRIAASAVSVVFCGLYTLMTGAGSSITRAFLFICIGDVGRLMPERSHSPIRTWCLALIIQLCLFPEALLSVGMQLSYLAMLGIFTLFPIMRDWYPSAKFDPLRKIWEAAALSISCQIFTAPLAYFTFGTFPVYFLLTNLIALPLTEALIISGIVVLLLSAAGICPEILAVVPDKLAEMLCGALGLISRM